MPERPLTSWERDVVSALLSVEPDGASSAVPALGAAVPHLVVTEICGCGCPSFTVRDSRRPRGATNGVEHFSDARTLDGRVSAILLVHDEAPYAVDVMLPPGIAPSPAALSGTAPRARERRPLRQDLGGRP